MLITDEMSAEWNPQAFHDTYREDLMRRIREKTKKNETHVLGSEPKKTPRPKANAPERLNRILRSVRQTPTSRCARIRCDSELPSGSISQ
jgi:non-homologous end joining protein Ku